MSAFIAIILGISLLISFHELGHFLAARWLGIKVLRFSLGFGRVIASLHDKQGTEYVISLLPLGGYVKLLDTREKPIESTERDLAFNLRPVWQRALVVIAGPLFNFVLAVILFAAVFFTGFTTLKPIIGQVYEHSQAEQAGLQAGDQIIQVDNYLTKNWQKVAMVLVINYQSKDAIRVVVQRGDQQLTYFLPLHNWELEPLKPKVLESLGIVPYIPRTEAEITRSDVLHTIHYSLGKSVKAGLENTWLFSYFNLLMLKKLIVGELSFKSLGGPLSVISSLNVAAKQHVLAYLTILAILSIGLGIVNLLPIPGLDGGQLLFLVYEGVMGRPISQTKQWLLFRLGIVVLVVLMCTVIINDLLRILEVF